MSKQRVIKDLATWKGIYVSWRNVCERAEPGFKYWAQRYLNTAKRVVENIEAKKGIKKVLILIALVLALLLGGCQTFKGATGDGAWMLQKLSDNVVTEK